MRIGFGLDRHQLAAGRRCVLGGVVFPDSPVGPVGHSDGDAVCHAAADAILGAAALGDIGQHFPDTDPRFRGADSLELLAEAATRVRAAGWLTVNLDLTVMTEKPHLAAHKAAMAANLARALAVDAAQVSVKATRGEGVGPEGRGEAVTVHAVALLAPLKNALDAD
ncbi:MAG: 2-C-methyl-D-erythritol 2,4-cyclodiphosphate synthase [Candidatus Krumholzibacteria bacterium]|jgi:2-C-methyl-D-erythritol 2,4-cyclodiphosphate synthase|nr:2-C-methyl-D-erythritol 2,4-cyclodiphosphate synthase [Candidatus Krumholzibacteria bacterium]